MAFRMNRPVIKGTANHKASIAKAKAQPVVSQSRTKGDAGLIAAASALGESYKPAAIDFELDKIDIDVPEKKEKKKEKQPKVKKDTWYRDVDEDGNVISRGWKSIKDKIKGEREQKELDYQVEQEDKNIIQAEKDAAKLEADKLKKAELDKKEIEKALALERRNEEKLKKRLIREEAAERRRNRNKKSKIKVGEVKTTGIGDQQIDQQTRQYTKEQRERLNTGEEGGNIWSNDLERYVLPEEIVDGQFVSKAEGETIIVSPNIKGKTTEPVVGETKTITPTDKPKISDFKTKKNAFGGTLTAKEQYEKALKEYYSKSPMDMRDNRIYRNAIKGGTVQQNMIKSGYIPE